MAKVFSACFEDLIQDSNPFWKKIFSRRDSFSSENYCPFSSALNRNRGGNFTAG